ncbi:MAG: polysaccharide deacetylase family protein [Candidatus Hydrogenedentes bacterium]|nr:polysaccharide deacetylase family protein [Candidatus Hydrogenedentota bacterium]
MISTAFDTAVGSIPIPLRVLTAVVRRDVVGVLYHCISDELVIHAAGIMPVKTVRQFESDLDSLQRHFNLVSYNEVVAHRQGGKRLPPRAVLLTVDDGFSNAYTVVRPILKRRGVPAIFFVITETLDNRMMADTHRKALCNYRMAVGRRGIEDIMSLFNQQVPESPRDLEGFREWFNMTTGQGRCLDILCAILETDVEAYLSDHRPYMTRDEVRTMSAEGFTMGAHSKTHRELWLLGEGEELDLEISESCGDVCRLTGKSAAPFSFPYQSNRIRRSVLGEVRACHPHVGLMFDTHGFRKDSEFFVGRQCFDNPVGAGPGGSNLCLAMRHAYLAQVFWSLRGRGKIS